MVGCIWSDIHFSACPMPCARMVEMWPSIMDWSTPILSLRRDRAVLSIAAISTFMACTLDLSMHWEKSPHPSTFEGCVAIISNGRGRGKAISVVYTSSHSSGNA